MPHSPVSITRRITQSKSPWLVSSNTEKLNIKTRVVWKHITRNCVVTCEARISIPVTPDTRHRSKMPSFRSINMAPDVRATDKKKIILRKRNGKVFSIESCFFSVLFRSWCGIRWPSHLDDSLYQLEDGSCPRVGDQSWLLLDDYHLYAAFSWWCNGRLRLRLNVNQRSASIDLCVIENSVTRNVSFPWINANRFYLTWLSEVCTVKWIFYLDNILSIMKIKAFCFNSSHQ